MSDNRPTRSVKLGANVHQQTIGTNMSGKTPDRRIGKTRSALADGLFALMQRTPWNAITIQAICEEANVARASFYAHFDSKINLLDFMLEQKFDGMGRAMVNDTAGGANSVLSWLVDHVSSSRFLFAKIALANDALPALQRFKATVARQFSEALALEGSSATPAQVRFIMGGTFDLILDWSKNWQVKQLPVLKANVLEMSARILSR